MPRQRTRSSAWSPLPEKTPPSLCIHHMPSCSRSESLQPSVHRSDPLIKDQISSSCVNDWAEIRLIIWPDCQYVPQLPFWKMTVVLRGFAGGGLPWELMMSVMSQILTLPRLLSKHLSFYVGETLLLTVKNDKSKFGRQQSSEKQGVCVFCYAFLSALTYVHPTGRKGHRYPLHPQCHTLYRRHPGLVPSFCSAGLQTAQWQQRGHHSLVSQRSTDLWFQLEAVVSQAVCTAAEPGKKKDNVWQ